MASKRKPNEVVADNWDWVEIDVSTPLHKDASIMLDLEDWEYLSELQKQGSLGRITLSDYFTFGVFWPAARLRGKQKSLLVILFNSHGGVRCKTDDWLDLRRSNLEWNHAGPLHNLGSTKWQKSRPFKRKVQSVHDNRVLSYGGTVEMRAEDREGNTHTIYMQELDLATLKEVGAGKVYIKKIKQGGLMPYARVVKDRRPVQQSLIWILHGGDKKYKTPESGEPNFFDLLPGNIMDRRKVKHGDEEEDQ